MNELATLAAAPRMTRQDSPRPITHRHLPYLCAVVAVAVYVCWPLLDLEMWGGHDAGYYPPRYVEFYHLLANGIFPPRWAPDFSFGYGEPFFSFNPPVVYLLNSAIHRLGPSVIASENIEVLILAVLAALGMYRLSVDFCGPRGALVAAAAYVSAPYFLVSLYVRHSMPDFTAFAFLPYSFWGLYHYVKGGKSRHLLVGSLATALLVLSSNPIALVTLPGQVACMCILAVSRRQVSMVTRGVVLLALGLGLSAYFWLPAFAERDLVHTERLILPGYLSYANHFVYWWQLLMSPWGYGDSVPRPDDGMSFSVGLLHVALVALAIVLYFSVRRKQDVSPPIAFPTFLGLGLVLLPAFLTTSFSAPFWDALTVLHYLQFPWRLLSLVSFGTALLCGVPLAIAEARHRPARWASVLATALLLCAVLADSWGNAHPNPDWQPQPSLTDLSAGQVAADGLPVDLEGEFEPSWLALSPFRPPSTTVDVVAGRASVREESRTPDRLDFSVTASEMTRLRVNIHYFPGWTVLDQGTIRAIQASSPDDLMEFDITPGTHQITVVFRDTPVRRLGNALSLLAASLLLWSPIWCRRYSHWKPLGFAVRRSVGDAPH